MDIKDLDKRQLILLTLLITFVVSIATGIVTVSLMKQMPTSVPQTINNVIQRTIEKVTTVEVPAKRVPEVKPSINQNQENIDNSVPTLLGDGDVVVSIYPIGDSNSSNATEVSTELPKELGQGIIISEVGLVLVESNVLNGADKYRIILDKMDFDASVLKRFNNGFSILKISLKQTDASKTNGVTEAPVLPVDNN